MPQEWESGSAARQPGYDESNPFAPVDYASRLQGGNRPRSASHTGGRYHPGQLYSAPVPSAPPAAAPAYEIPSYLQPAQQTVPPMQAEEGAPYSAALFDHQPPAVMPGSWDVSAFAERPDQQYRESAPAEAPAWAAEEEPYPEDQPLYYAKADIPMRDPFTPAAPREEKNSGKPQVKAAAPQPKQRLPLRLERLFALIAAAVMLAVCAVVGGGLVLDLMRNEREMEAFRSEYLENNGVDVYNGAARVDLLPEGQTYVPTATPSPTLFAPTPSPTPIIPVYGGLNLVSSGETPVPEATAAQPLRTRQTSYPDNPMCNITESLREMVEKNSDVIGRLVIPGVLDEMVMQRNNTYYLNHNSIGTPCEYGAVFADQSCMLRMPPENLLLRGQGGIPGKTFEPLWQYVSGGTSFVSANMVAQLTTLYEEEHYVLFAVIAADTSPSSSRYFNYASNPTFTSDEAMLHYVETARSHSLYQFNVDVLASDRLLTLATLGNGQNSLVLLFRMVRDTEGMGR